MESNKVWRRTGDEAIVRYVYDYENAEEQAARVRACNYINLKFTSSTKNSTMHFTSCIEISHFVSVVKRTHGQCSTFTVQYF